MTGTRGYTTKNRNTAGVTTTGTRGPEDLGVVTIDGVKVNVRPQPLMLKKADKEKIMPSDMGKPVSGASGQPMDSQKSQDPSQQDLDKKKNDKQKKESMSIHSQLTSSLMETSEAEKSEDERRRKKEEEKKKKKGFTEEELEQLIDVELTETKTITLMFERSVVVN